jgi:hypothetical protein
LPNLPANSVAVLENVAYHCIQRNKRPISTLKYKYCSMARKSGYKFFTYNEKPQLLELAKSVRTEKLCYHFLFLLDDIIKENEHENTLCLCTIHPDLNSIRLVSGDIRNRVAQESISTNFKEKQMFCKKYLVNTQKKNGRSLFPCENEGILAMRWLNGCNSRQHDYSLWREF